MTKFATSTLRATPAKRPVSKVAELSVIAIIGIIPVFRVFDDRVANRLDLFILIVLLSNMLLGRVNRPQGLSIWVLAMLLIPSAALLSGTSSSIRASLSTGIELAIILGVLPFVLTHFVVNYPLFQKRAVTTFLLVQSLSSLVGLAQLGGLVIFELSARGGRANGLASHPNVLGLMSVIAVLICISILLRVGAWRLSVVLALIINSAALIASGSLSSLIALGVALPVLLIASRATLKAVAMTIGLGIFATTLGILFGFDYALLLEGLEDRVQSVTGHSIDGTGSFVIRQSTYSFAWDYIRANPLIGVGMDAMNQGTFNGSTVVHNYWLRAWYQGGIILVTAWSLITAWLMTVVIRSMVFKRGGLAASVIVCIIVYALTSAFYNQVYYLIPLLLAACSCAVSVNDFAKGSGLPSRSVKT